ncbi:neuroglobin-like [Babylonia areolata]|uniref:neuroglobin-like n=1 Tax=Babylonia areolata TaxID=304850 RepID=UPI003FCF33BF
MGCEFGKPQVITMSPEEPEAEMTGFSDTQIDTIRSTWPLLSGDHGRVGADIFSRIFREAPSVQDLFHHFHIHKSEDMYQSKVFAEHAARFLGVIQDLVDNLECPQNIDQQLLILGAKHATFDGYHPEYFRLYTKCMMEVWEVELGEEFIHEVKESWRLAFEYVVERMTEGFDMCLGGEMQDFPDDSSSLDTPVKEQHTTTTTTGSAADSTGGGVIQLDRGCAGQEFTSSNPSSPVEKSIASPPSIIVKGVTRTSSLADSPVEPLALNGGPSSVGRPVVTDNNLTRVQ